MNWDNWRFFLAAHRAGTLSGAANALGVTHATVGRRLTALEESLDTKLFERVPAGLELTEAGRTVLEKAASFEEHICGLQRAITHTEARPAGTVCLGVSGAMSSYFLPHLLADFRQTHPDIHLDIVETTRFTSLPRGEAEVALRLTSCDVSPGRPSVVVRRVGRVAWDLFGHPDLVKELGLTAPVDDLAGLPFVAFNEQAPGRPDRAWLEAQHTPPEVVFSSNSVESNSRAIDSGVGVGLLLNFIGDHYGLCALTNRQFSPMDVWVATHSAIRDTPRVAAVFDFLVDRASRWPGFQ